MGDSEALDGCIQVRFVFESQQGAIGASAQKDTSAKGEKNRDSMNLMKKVLERVMARERSVITEWCSRNSTQMQTALNAVTHLHEQAENMQKDLQDAHASLAVRLYSVKCCCRIQ